jgi:hypothetical protein
MLVTSRRKEQAYLFKPRGPVYLVQQFTGDESLQMFKQLLGPSYNPDNPDDVAAAAALLGKIDGLAIAICTIATRITARGVSIKKYLRRYKKVSLGDTPDDDIQLEDYDTSLEAIYSSSFAALEEKEGQYGFHLLGIISFLSPNEIPQKLFVREDSAPLGKFLEFCDDEDRQDNSLLHRCRH